LLFNNNERPHASLNLRTPSRCRHNNSPKPRRVQRLACRPGASPLRDGEIKPQRANAQVVSFYEVSSTDRLETGGLPVLATPSFRRKPESIAGRFAKRRGNVYIRPRAGGTIRGMTLAPPRSGGR
jgi:hypothetical protein